MRRVVVTGIGLHTSIGEDAISTWHNLLECKSGIKKITKFDTSDLPCKIAGFISDNPESENYSEEQKFLDPKVIKRNDRFIRYGLYGYIIFLATP